MATSLRRNNPYSIGTIINYSDGTQSLERSSLAYVATPNDKLHLVRDFDTLPDVAHLYYKDSKWWWVLMDINNIENPFLLQPGQNIIIPDLDRLIASAL